MKNAVKGGPEVSLAGGGTEKSVKLLRQAMRSRNVQVKATAKMALQKVLDRKKAAEQEKVQE